MAKMLKYKRDPNFGPAVVGVPGKRMRKSGQLQKYGPGDEITVARAEDLPGYHPDRPLGWILVGEVEASDSSATVSSSGRTRSRTKNA